MFSRLNPLPVLLTVCFVFTCCYRCANATEISPFAGNQQVVSKFEIESFIQNSSFFENEIEISKAARSRRSVFLLKQNATDKIVSESIEKPATNKSQPMQRPRFYLPHKTTLPVEPKMYLCDNKSSEKCQNKTVIFRDRIVSEFRKSTDTVVDEPNYYHVQESKKLSKDASRIRATCMVIKAKVRILRKRDAPFNEMPLGKLFPKRKLFKAKPEIRSCAIVSSAGSLSGAKLGRFIDLHDIVMRFNHAPVEGYEEDVGSKTTIRVVNSQVVSKAEFDFVRSAIFQNITIAAWDPGKYNGTLSDWHDNVDFNLFANYEKFRKRYPKSSAYVIDPLSIWNLWDQLQSYTITSIRRNPPSSGFIGLALLLPHCRYVDFIEYIPSTRLNGRCHYYSEEINAACTFGAWHPLAAEKLMTLKMNVADDFAVFQNGITRIRRPEPRLCLDHD